MGPRFDPAVVEVLEAFGQRLLSGSESAISAREVLKTTSLEPDGARAREILKQLVSEGLLAESGPGGRETSGTYSLTSLGRSRIEQRKRKEED
jgi:DNA-binding PadR family transcriptional regulator